MNFSFYKTIAWLSLGVLLALAALGLIILATDPFEASLMVFVAFYLGVMLAVMGLTVIVGLSLRKKWLESAQGSAWALRTSIRQGLILGVLAVLVLVSLNLRWFNLYTFLGLILLTGGTEYLWSKYT